MINNNVALGPLVQPKGPWGDKSGWARLGVSGWIWISSRLPRHHYIHFSDFLNPSLCCPSLFFSNYLVLKLPTHSKHPRFETRFANHRQKRLRGSITQANGEPPKSSKLVRNATAFPNQPLCDHGDSPCDARNRYHESAIRAIWTPAIRWTRHTR